MATATQQTFTYAQLEGLWIQNGGNPATAPIAAAIAMAESTGRSWVTSANPDGGTNVGPWQLDTKGVGSGYSVAQLQDPNTNAAVAVKGSDNGTNWSDWATYASGAYKAFMNNATTPDTSGIGSASTASNATLDSSTTSTDCAIKFPGIDLGVTSVGGGCLVTYGTERAIIAGLVLGAAGILALVGFVILAASAIGSTPAGRIAESVTPVGRVVSAVTPSRKAAK
jgi:Lysozyme like domain